MKDHRSIMLELQKTHDVIYDLLKGQPFHYTDIPMHDNIGDLLIMQGTLAFFKKKGLSPKTTSTASGFDPSWVEPGDILVFHGGGNFGDLYTNINDLREDIITRFPNNRIVMMPQTIFFSSEAKRDRSASIFRRHPDVHIFIRDRVSQGIARLFSDHVYLVPDMAHQLYPIASTGSGTGVLRIERVDVEAPQVPQSLKDLRFDTRTDWVEVIGTEKRFIDFAWRLECKFRAHRWDVLQKRLGPWYWVPMAQRFSNKAIDLFSVHDHIVTDRLHGHILSCLMDKKNTVIDNSYGKNSTYINEWTGNSDLVQLVKAEANPEAETCASPT
ncbi:exopolysaccharide biosynthesis protein [Duganella dendranthematis]|uniref:Exopolysaccharide biosynthesis protein n=1 Tax=Duganella dendranthematis TaxID=2728021 RepID=A0ABX6MCM7_9BURK|nr:polysaccharide pyruvyl transferase family protein [Duganella dendranthematis]QJD92078.1 exopolysaccharide biosynthesis protein [Duganella dendranthematis]